MRLTIQLKLQPMLAQAEALRRTLATANEACNLISRAAWANRTFRQFDLHHICYHDVRVSFGLSAQVVVRCIAKVADAYKRNRTKLRRFHPYGAIAYDSRILAFNLAASSISIWTLAGRQQIAFACGERQRSQLQHQQGEADLVYRDDTWYLYVSCNV